MSTTQLRRELGKKELFGIAIGQVIGAGIMALVGYGIAMTGRSVNLAMVLSAVWVILLSIPWIFISSCLRLRGGEYTQAAVLCGERFAGIHIAIYLVRNLQWPPIRCPLPAILSPSFRARTASSCRFP